MNLDDTGSASGVEGLLRKARHNAESNPTTKEKLRRALSWYNGRNSEPISLIDWLAIVRAVGKGIAVRFDDGIEYRYLAFDTARNRVIMVNPTHGIEVPIEDTNIQDIFKRSVVSLVTEDKVRSKTFKKLTAVTNDEHGTRLIFGHYPDGVVSMKDDEEVEFETKNTFSLPHPMHTEEIEEWLDEDSTVKDIIIKNHERGWGRIVDGQLPGTGGDN